MKATIRLTNGKLFDLLDPQPELFGLQEIAWSLGHQCRFGGHCSAFYSVAEHSVLCSWSPLIRDDDERRAVLLHDAAEAFVGDVVRPLKHLIPEFDVIESRVLAVIATKYGIDFAKHASAIKSADNDLLEFEIGQLFLNTDSDSEDESFELHSVSKLLCLPPQKAATFFLAEAARLGLPLTTDH